MENSDKIVQESNAEAVLKSELKGDEAINDPINPDIAYLKSLRSKTPTNKIEETTFKFRENVKIVIPQLIKENKSAGPVVKKLKRVVGGC